MAEPPDSAVERFHRGTCALNRGDAAAAECAFRDALRRCPDLAEAHANLGLLLEQQGRWEEAEVCYLLALERQPRRVRIHLNLGSLLATRKRFAEAEAAYRQALRLDPDAPAAWSNLGALLAGLKRESEAERCYRTALLLDPDHRAARFNLAYVLLRQGRFEEGWRCLEARVGYAPLERYLRVPRWQGEALAGKSLLIGFEAGLGDQIQFCRYATLAKRAGASRVTLLCHPGLKPLLATHRDLDEVIAIDEPFADSGWDYWSPLLSLPLHFGTRLDTIPAESPYLSVDPRRVAGWSEVIGAAPRTLKVGLVWKGNPGFENDADRSLPSSAPLAPLGEVEAVRFFSLQKGEGEGETAPPSLRLVDLAPRLADFADTAAAVARLDLVITVDTAVAHLCGALGRRAWVLLPDYKSDWRWLAAGDDSPWYPGCLRLFRQGAAGSWDEVVGRLVDALRQEVEKRGPGDAPE